MPIAATSPRLPLDQLLESVRAGHSPALADLYDQFAAPLFRVAYGLTGSKEDAEDVVHDVFLGLPEAMRRYEDHGNFGAWLRRVAVRVVLMKMRTRRRRGETALDAVAEPPSSQRADARAEYGDVERAVMALPDTLRAVFVLRQIEGYAYDEIASVLGISTGAARVRFTRALESLRQTLS